MSLDISSNVIEPVRLTYGHIERRIGKDKPASRYQEATYDIQPTTNFHYRPLWDKNREIYDASLTKIVMEDWYTFTDPRQYYYGVYTQARAKQQEVAEKNYTFVDKRELLSTLSDEAKQAVRDLIIPLRHTEWGANMNNCEITDSGYGVSITQVTMFNAMDRLGLAQYITRIGLMLEGNDPAILDTAKEAWLSDDMWQELRHAVEDSFVLDDWFETMVAQNIVMDGFIYPLIFGKLVDKLVAEGGASVAMLTEFMNEWYAETVRWTNALMKATAKESDANTALLNDWVKQWSDRVEQALLPVASHAFGEDGASRLAEVKQQLLDRLSKQGIKV